MKKEKARGLETIIHKYKNRKFDLEKQQKQEKSLNDNNNLLKASKKNNKLTKYKFTFIFRNYYQS
jgi:hypothetical protein